MALPMTHALQVGAAPLLPPLEKGATGDLLLILVGGQCIGKSKSKSPSIPLFQRGRRSTGNLTAVEITSGLKEGESIVISGSDQFADAESVRIN